MAGAGPGELWPAGFGASGSVLDSLALWWHLAVLLAPAHFLILTLRLSHLCCGFLTLLSLSLLSASCQLHSFLLLTSRGPDSYTTLLGGRVSVLPQAKPAVRGVFLVMCGSVFEEHSGNYLHFVLCPRILKITP